MTRRPRAGRATFALVGGLGALALAGCGSTSNRTTGAASSNPGSGAPASAATVEVRSTGLGPVLATSGGKVIYLLTADRPGSQACSGSCLRYWPPVMVSATPSAPGGVTAHLGELAVSGGKQLTVNGQPAYTYIGDSSAGQTSGEGIRSFGGTWWAFSPAGAAVTGAASATTSTSRAGYGGY